MDDATIGDEKDNSGKMKLEPCADMVVPSRVEQ
jgi:hypothetical protein